MKRLWWAFFAYAASVALVVQFVLLPYVFHTWHAGNGLLVGGDWVFFHRLAVELAQRIHIQGWSAWELRPDGQTPAGIAGAIYALILPQPWILIPINAALHATAGLVLLRIMQVFVANWRLAIWSILPFLLYPSAMTWYTQIHKDGYFIAGTLFFIYGWISLAQLETWKRCWWSLLRAVLWIILGAVFVWIVRPYSVKMMQGIAAVLSILLTCVFLVRGARAKLPWRKAIAALLLGWVMVFAITPLTVGTSVEGPPISWVSSSRLPSFIEDKLYALAVVRERFRAAYPKALSNIDVHIGFRSATEIIAYIPRAVQIVLLAPFPNQWFVQGSLEANTMMRRISAIEMIGVYLTMAFLPYAIWHWRRRIEIWVILAFCKGMMLIYGLTIPNIGSIYRVRYGYIMTLVALGIAVCFAAWQEFLLRCRLKEVVTPN